MIDQSTWSDEANDRSSWCNPSTSFNFLIYQRRTQSYIVPPTAETLTFSTYTAREGSFGSGPCVVVSAVWSSFADSAPKACWVVVAYARGPIQCWLACRVCQRNRRRVHCTNQQHLSYSACYIFRSKNFFEFARRFRIHFTCSTKPYNRYRSSYNDKKFSMWTE